MTTGPCTEPARVPARRRPRIRAIAAELDRRRIHLRRSRERRRRLIPRRLLGSRNFRELDRRASDKLTVEAKRAGASAKTNDA
jgi:hypothetical protein